MKTLFVALVAFSLHVTTAVKHSMIHFYTASSEVLSFPEFVIVGMVDDYQIQRYDSKTKRAEPNQDWVNKITDDYPEYWTTQLERATDNHERLKFHLENAKKLFNHSEGVHIFQNVDRCEWDDETGEVNGYEQYGYDGEDFLVLDMKTMTWIAPQQKAVFIKRRWDQDEGYLEYIHTYYTVECIEWLKKFVNFGRSSLMRTDLPTVSLLQKTPSSRITCHATGFYPARAVMFWRKDGEELYEDVEHGEILPNHDKSYQRSVDLELPSDDWGKYECVFKLSGVKEEIVTKLDKRDIKTNYVNPMNTIIIIVAVIAVIVLLIFAVIGYKVYSGRTPKRETSSELAGVTETLNPEPDQQQTTLLFGDVPFMTSQRAVAPPPVKPHRRHQHTESSSQSKKPDYPHRMS